MTFLVHFSHSNITSNMVLTWFRGLVTFNRLAAILLIIWVSSAAGLKTVLMLQLGPDLCHTVADVNPASRWSWPLPVAIIAVQVHEIVTPTRHQVADVKLFFIPLDRARQIVTHGRHQAAVVEPRTSSSNRIERVFLVFKSPDDRENS